MGSIAVPQTLDQALDPDWLSGALGLAIASTGTVEVIRTVATKVRFRAHPTDGSAPLALCLKGLLDDDPMMRMGGPTMVREADFYGKVAEYVAVRVPHCVKTVIDRENQQAVVIMRDLIADGAVFCSALDPFSADDAAASLEQLAALHAGSGLLADRRWITHRVGEFAARPHLSVEALQNLLNDPRGDNLPPATRNAARLLAALAPLARHDAARAQFLVHGDAHAGNVFRTAQGPGLIDWQLLQSGGWALDVAYHINAVLPVDLAAREERRLLIHYLNVMRAGGYAMPDDETAWAEYREACVYGYYLWAITRRVDPAIIHTFTARLGAAVTRHDSFAVLGV
ncbi:MAG: phosphotransferase [Novosphingobium sp.]